MVENMYEFAGCLDLIQEIPNAQGNKAKRYAIIPGVINIYDSYQKL